MPSYQWFHLEFLHSNPIGDYRFVFEDTFQLLFVLSSLCFNNQEKSIAKNILENEKKIDDGDLQDTLWFCDRMDAFLLSAAERYSTVNRLYVLLWYIINIPRHNLHLCIWNLLSVFTLEKLWRHLWQTDGLYPAQIPERIAYSICIYLPWQPKLHNCAMVFSFCIFMLACTCM